MGVDFSRWGWHPSRNCDDYIAGCSVCGALPNDSFKKIQLDKKKRKRGEVERKQQSIYYQALDMALMIFCWFVL